MPVKYDVLVTDDDNDVRSFITDALAYEGYMIWSLPTHAITLEIIREINPSLIILELQPATMSTIASFYKQLTRNTLTNHIGILLTTTDSGLMKHMVELQAFPKHQFLLKPFDLVDLFDQVKQLIDSSGNSIPAL